MEYRGLTLDGFQKQAVEHIEQGKSVLVAAPTGTGKTLIADYLIDQVIEQGRHVIYTAPVKALSNQKYRQYTALFGRENVGLITGDIVINRDAPIRIMTTEILRNILLQQGSLEEQLPDEERDEWIATETPATVEIHDLADLAAVIIDEIHFVDDPERGTVWEELLIYLPTEIRILGLSATLSNLEEFADWLSSIRGRTVEVVREERRAVPLEIRVASTETGLVEPPRYDKAYGRWRKAAKKAGVDLDACRGGRRGRGGGSRRRRGGGSRGRGRRGREADEFQIERTGHIEVLELLGEEMLPALYFIYSRKLTEKLAVQLSKSHFGRDLGRSAQRREIVPLLDRFEEDYPGVMSRSLRINLERGIAYHHAGLHVGLKALVEELYERRLIQVLYSTSTFALGINMPARTVIFDSLTKFNGVDIVPLSVREFMQMAGRAGRRGIDEHGDVVVKLDFDQYEEVRGLLKTLLSGASEPVSSSFNLSFNSVVNLLDRYSESHIRTILERSFRAYQSMRDAEELREEIDRHEADESEGGLSRKGRKRLAALNRQLVEAERPMLWEQFQRKVSFLRSYGYLGANNELHNSARILQQIQFEEIFVTELVVGGVLEDRSAEEIFGIMCGLVQTLPRTARVDRPDAEKWWPIFDEVQAVYESDVVWNAQQVVQTESTFTPPLMPLGEQWARGRSLAAILGQISNPTDLSGDIVGAFRRAKDLVGQLRNVYWEDVERRKELTAVLRAVTRDEVEVID